VAGAGVPGEVGLKVTSRPEKPTTVHWVGDGHASGLPNPAIPTPTGDGVPGAAGLKVSSRPPSSSAVHWVMEGQATA
jgi:hypothetical protein